MILIIYYYYELIYRIMGKLINNGKISKWDQ